MDQVRIGISAIEYVLPPDALSLEELARDKLLCSSPEQLRRLGFERCYVSNLPAEALASQAAKTLLEREAVDREDVDLLIYAGALASSHQVSEKQFLGSFNYPAAKMQFELGLLHAGAIGISQSGCLGFTNAVKVAIDFLRANQSRNRVLCVGADVLPAGANREILYNVISDGACALLVERDSPRNKVLAHGSVTKGYYWDSISSKNEIMAAYFPTAKNVIADVLKQAGCTRDQVELVIPHNVSLLSWEILLDLIGLEKEQLFYQNIRRKGHVIAGDNWINLKDAVDEKRLQPGDRFLSFNFGFGANWAATLMEH
jgi:3-oxoacyl-[acyl-carrier-protein] synthase-3